MDLGKPESKPLFLTGPSPAVRCFGLVLLSIVLMVFDYRAGHLDTVRNALSLALHPLRVAVDLPFTVTDWAGESLSERRRLLAENDRLREQHLETQARLQRFDALQRENERLRELMDSSTQVSDRVLVSEIMSVDLAPRRHRIVINKGTAHGAYQGQPLLDADGVVGQVTHTNPISSEAMLISDASHAVPVEVNRNGLRTIAVGTGDHGKLNLPFLPNNADIEPGDLLITSGLGGSFPAGYPVAVVTNIDRDPGNPFATVEARPAAALNRNRQVMLVWSSAASAVQVGATDNDEEPEAQP
ncbi:MAG: rod shape-determining protein MreC [Gammaproteobacteria bacterium]|nr:rod shape-determining protein MreC [Gammaproteobacteria bacterium]